MMKQNSSGTSAKTAGQHKETVGLRNKRVHEYRNLVTPIAVHYGRRCPEPIEDLIQVGLMGLLRAAELYDAKTRTPFEAFARPHIRGAILHYLRDSATAVRLPRRQMELHDKLRKVQAGWYRSHSQEASSEDLRRALMLDAQQWLELQRGKAMSRPINLADELLDAWGGAAPDQWGDGAGRLSDDGPAEELLGLRRHWAQLEPDIRQVIDKVVICGWTYRRTAAHLMVSPMTVQRRLKRGLAELRQGLGKSAHTPISCPSCQHPALSAAQGC